MMNMILAFPQLLATLSLGNPFTEGMVLQRERPVPVWGTADKGETVSVSFAGQTKVATADADGKWRVTLDPLATSSEGRTLTVTSQTSQTSVSDVLVGEVWLVSGQSNMDVPLVGPNPRYRDGQGVAEAAVTRLPSVRWNIYSHGEKKWGWHRFESSELSRPHAISAVAFYFAREVHRATGLPIGLVCAYGGGSNIEMWTPKCGYEKTGLFPELLNWKRIPQDEWTTNNHYGAINHWSKQPSMTFERYFEPLAPFAARGMIWYQGEQNAGSDRTTYDQKLHTLLTGYETVFENPDLKFYMVQIPRPCSNPEFQMTQARFVKRHAADGRVKMAVISDIANTHEVHPAEKEPVGRRLAYLALRYDYGFGALEAESPEATHAYAEGTNVHVQVAHAAKLTVYNARHSFESRFEVAGADGRFHPATVANPLVTFDWGKEWRNGELAGNEIVVASDKVAEPKQVRYLHSRPYDSNVFNESGLPLGTFALDVGRFPVRPVAYGPTFRDRLWMWGHHTEFTEGRKEDGTPRYPFIPCQKGMDMAEACKYMGIPNCCVVLFVPSKHPLKEFLPQFKDMTRVAWSIGETDVGTQRERIDRVYAAAKDVPGLKTMYLDDYFVKEMGCTLEVPKLKEIKAEIAAKGYNLACVLYSDQDGLKDEFKPHIAECEEVSYWFWRQQNLDGLEKSVRDCRAFVGAGKSLLLGLYMYEFAGKTKLMPPELMRRQLEVAERLMKDGTVDGLIFHCTPICNSGAEAVEISRQWIAEHGEDVWGGERK